MTTTSHEARVGQWGPLAYVKELWARRHFVLYLGMSRIKSRNANTALGLFWWLINPLLLGMVYFLVFGVILARRPPEFIPYLLTGLFAFHFTNGAATGGARSITAGHNLMMSVVFPRLILPLATLLETLAGFLASLVLLVPLVILLTPVTLS
ncbi:MAG TPA: hypothetical protein VHG52_03795, partial [Thermomicrobiales bacterium]|nr:hypothetical protein [Thermomicrobiales bacterium]